MKQLFTLLFTIVAVASYCFEVMPYGPDTGDFTYANLTQSPISFGIAEEGDTGLFVEQYGIWNYYECSASGLPITSICNLNESTLMVAMGCGSYSDGVYNFSLDTHSWELNDWFMYPNFIKYNPNNNLYYVGERDGLFKSTDGENWSRITSMGMAECNSMSFYGEHLVANNGPGVRFSSDMGQTWQSADTSNLKGFHYMSCGALYAIMDVESDSDGLWRSEDFGATWDHVLYTSNLNCIGPAFGEYLVLGWRQPNEAGSYVAVMNSEYQLNQLIHPSLNGEVLQLDRFPLINTLSFFVLNPLGCFYITSFLPVQNNDQCVPPVSRLNMQVYPNPFYSETTIELDGKNSDTALKVEIYNLKGQKVKCLFDGVSTGENTLCWDARDCNGKTTAPGLYLIKAQQDGNVQCRKVLLTR
ncbi:MAG: T9SS type A sorting domain-containing protein [Candidatus Cloacimonetes bacterium]|nr:T9SS type A sorting domain-containing protein [Candidatus Cloacimonadota bacterium]